MLKNILTKAGLTLLLTAGLAASAAIAQQPGASAQEEGDGRRTERQQGMERWRKHRGRGARRAIKRAFAELNLDDAQKQQIQAIRERFKAGSQAKREEMRGLVEQRRSGATLTAEQLARAGALRAEFRESRQRLRDEIVAVLTPGQRTQLEQLKQERKARRQQMRERFRERRMLRQQNDEQ
ncbi:MAG TPA: Spy/CpxP family protein refolding chaperone [Pyrinomonadaceae bacterium]|jgi:Spy/CpxP family protein refolding chaperone|nr:Spy/CpxP family protein refolding chaperone [Pyrinomonadaceae bacterium]